MVELGAGTGDGSDTGGTDGDDGGTDTTEQTQTYEPPDLGGGGRLGPGAGRDEDPGPDPTRPDDDTGELGPGEGRDSDPGPDPTRPDDDTGELGPGEGRDEDPGPDPTRPDDDTGELGPEPEPEPRPEPEPEFQPERERQQDVEAGPPPTADAGPGRLGLGESGRQLAEQRRAREAYVSQEVAAREEYIQPDEVSLSPTGEVEIAEDYLLDEVRDDPSVRGRVMGTRQGLLEARREAAARQRAADQLRDTYGLPGDVDLSGPAGQVADLVTMGSSAVLGRQSDTARQIGQAIRGFGEQASGPVYERGDEIQVQEVNPRQQAAAQRFGGIGAAGNVFSEGITRPGRTPLEDIPTTGYQAELTPTGRRTFYEATVDQPVDQRAVNPATGEAFLAGVDPGTDITVDDEGQITAIGGQPVGEPEDDDPPDIDTEAAERYVDSGSIGLQLTDEPRDYEGADNIVTDIGAGLQDLAGAGVDTTLDAADAGIGYVEDSAVGDFAGEVESSAPVQAVIGPIGTGPIGQGERALGGATYWFAESMAERARAYDAIIGQPAAEVGGDIAAAPLGLTATAASISGDEELAGELGAAQETVGSGTEKILGGVSTGLTTTTLGLPQAGVTTAETAGAGAEFTATAITEAESPTRGAVEAGTAGATVVGGVATQVAEQSVERPFMTGGMLLGSLPAGIAAGRALGAVGRRAAPRLRTVGGERIPFDELANAVVRDYYDPDRPTPPEGEYPSAADRTLYGTDPDEAIRQQAPDYTPDVIRQQYESAGVTEGTAVQKAIGTEPAGPRRGLASRGFESVPDESALTLDDLQAGGAFEYETPGAFVGPEASPNFWRVDVGDAPSPQQSLRPGLPDIFTGQPTQVFIQSDIDTPRASTLEGFRREMIQREGETTIRTKPPGVGSAGEAEAVAPPGAVYADVGSVTGGPLRNTLRRLGIGSDFYTVSPQGTRVPIRVAADPDFINASSRSFRDFLRGERAQLGAGDEATGTGYIRIDVARRRRRAQQTPVDRPLITPYGDADTETERVTTREPVERVTPSDPTEYVAPSEPVSQPLSEPVSEPVYEPVSQPSQPSPTSERVPSVPSQPSEGVPSQPSQPSIPSTPYTPPPSTPTTTGSGAGLTSTSITPPPTTPSLTTPRYPFPDDDTGRDEFPVFGGARQGIFTEFLDPIGGARLPTSEVDFPARPDQPVLIDYVVESSP